MTVVTEDVSVFSLITQVMDEIDSTDPEIIAKEVLTRVGDEHLRDFLLALLRPAVLKVFASRRGHALNSDPDKPRSSKVDGIRAVARFLDATVNVAGAFKRLGDCGKDDLLTAAQMMRQLAATHAQRANQYESYALLVKKHRVARVADLPAEVLRQTATAGGVR